MIGDQVAVAPTDQPGVALSKAIDALQSARSEGNGDRGTPGLGDEASKVEPAPAATT